MENLLRDLRISFRGLRRTPGTAFVAVFAFALGIGLTTLVFSIVWGVLIRGLPFEDSQEIVSLRRTNPSRGIFSMGVTIHDLTDWRADQRTFEGLVGYTNSSLSLSDDESSPQRLDGCYIEPEMFGVLGVQPVAGRAFTLDDAKTGAAPVMLIGWGVWQQRFGGAPDIVGRAVRINGEATTIIGVMPRGFGFPGAQNAWQPLKLDPLQLPRGQGGGLAVFGRLRDGVTVEQAVADIERIARRLAAEYPATNEGVGSRVYDFTDDMLGSDVRTALYAMFGSVVFVLLIACANVTNLLMARAMMRAREVGLRTALGASRVRVASQFLAESFALALSGALLGTGIAAFGIRLFNNAIADKRPPFWIDIRLDGVALLWGFLAMVAATLLAGALPALQAARASTSEILKDESRGGSSFRLGRISRMLVAGEMALSVGLLVGAGLMIKSVVKVQTVDLGFDARQVYTARLSLQQQKYADNQRRIAFQDELLARVRGLAGVESASLTTSAPGMGTGWATFGIEGATYLTDRDYPNATLLYVTPGFFETIDAAVVTGRDFTGADRDGAPLVAVVNRAFEKRHFPDGDALGQRIRIGGANSEFPWATIVGIVPDRFASGVEDRRPEAIYEPMAQIPPGTFSTLARTRGDPVELSAGIRSLLADMDPDLPMYSTGALEDVIRRDNWQYGVIGSLFVSFGLAALFLASVGLYGVMAFSVGRRTREIGVRMALGATRRDVLRMVLLQGLTQTTIGLAVGTAFALAVSRVIAALLFKVEPRDPAIFAAVIVVLLLTTVVACWVPARRAAAVDPLEAMRTE